MSEPRCARCQQPAPGLWQHREDQCIAALGEAVRALQASRQSIYRVRPSLDPDLLDSKGRLKEGSMERLEDFNAFCDRITGSMESLSADDRRTLYDNLWDLYQTDEPQPEGGEASASLIEQEPGASAGSNVGAPEQDETMAKIERLVDEFGRSYFVGRRPQARAALMSAIRARLRAPQGEPDPDLMEAWADWYDEHTGLEVMGPAGSVLRDLAKISRRAHRDATGDTDA